MSEGTENLPDLDKSQLTRIADQHKIFSDHEYLKIEEGLDSKVVRWRQPDGTFAVLKYYINSDLTRGQLETYKQSLIEAGKDVAKAPVIKSPIGDIDFRLVTIDQIKQINHPDSQFCVSKSNYIGGIELEKLAYSLDYVNELLQDSEIDQQTIDRIMQFAREWKIPTSTLMSQITEAVNQLNNNLKHRFKTDQVGCDRINLKVTANGNGFTIWVTDIATSIYRFVESQNQVKIN